MGLQLSRPYVVFRSGDIRVLVGAESISNLDALDTQAQLWNPRNGYSDIRLLQSVLKFLYEIETVTPPQPWSEKNAR